MKFFEKYNKKEVCGYKIKKISFNKIGDCLE
jgi:hypothetical protein